MMLQGITNLFGNGLWIVASPLNQQHIEYFVCQETPNRPFRPIIRTGNRASVFAHLIRQRDPQQNKITVAVMVGKIQTMFIRGLLFHIFLRAHTGDKGGKTAQKKINQFG